MDGGATEADKWREIAAQKEKEWKQATEQRLIKFICIGDIHTRHRQAHTYTVLHQVYRQAPR